MLADKLQLRSGLLCLVLRCVAFEKRLGFTLGFFKRIFLPPLEDFCRAGSLHDPMIDFGVMPSVKQDVGDVVPTREPGV